MGGKDHCKLKSQGFKYSTIEGATWISHDSWDDHEATLWGGEQKKNKTIALKSTTQKEEDTEKLENGEKDEDLALIIRKFKCFMKRRRQRTKRRPPAKEKSSK